MTSLGVMLLNGKGVTKDEAEAAQVLRKAVGLNNARAYYVLGIMTSQGLGVEKDEAEAARLYGKSADSVTPTPWSISPRCMSAARGSARTRPRR